MSLKSAIEKKVASRLAACRESARLATKALRDAGVQALPFGSSVKGDVHAESDLDILVVDRGNLQRGQILAIAERSSSVPVDVLFAEDVTPEALRSIQEDIAHADQIG